MTIVFKVYWRKGAGPEFAPKTVTITQDVEPNTADWLHSIIDHWMNATSTFYPGARIEFQTDEHLRERDDNQREAEERAGNKVTKIRSE